MAGTILADTLTHSTAGSLTTDYVVNGSAKAWINFNGSTATATADLTGVADSFNIDSLVDNGTGDYTVTMTNSMNNADYSLAGLVGNGTGSFNRGISTGYGTAPTASAYTLSSIISSSGSLTDCSYVSSHVMGDLA